MSAAGFLSQLLEIVIAIALAPLLTGWVNQWRAWLQNKSAPSLWQPYRVLHKLFNKESMVADHASRLFRTAPYVKFGCMVLACAIIPTLSTDLSLAPAAEIGLRHGQRRERIRTRQDHVMRNDVAIFERKHVQRSTELVIRQNQRRREPHPVPAGRQRDAPRQVGERQLFHERQCMNAIYVAFAIGDEGSQVPIENAAQIARQALECRRVDTRA